jgi:transposase
MGEFRVLRVLGRGGMGTVYEAYQESMHRKVALKVLHRSTAVEFLVEPGEPLHNLLRQHPRLHIEHFPAYAPELNPDEGVWSLAKRELANSCPHDADELMEAVLHSTNAIRTSLEKLRGCIVQSELPSFLR